MIKVIWWSRYLEVCISIKNLDGSPVNFLNLSQSWIFALTPPHHFCSLQSTRYLIRIQKLTFIEIEENCSKNKRGGKLSIFTDFVKKLLNKGRQICRYSCLL